LLEQIALDYPELATAFRGLAHIGINFETLLFGVAAPEAIKIARLVSRLVEIGLRQRHRRRTTWAGRSREVVPNLRYLLGCWHPMRLPPRGSGRLIKIAHLCREFQIFHSHPSLAPNKKPAR
jgi:hypothetical protein